MGPCNSKKKINNRIDTNPNNIEKLNEKMNGEIETKSNNRRIETSPNNDEKTIQKIIENMGCNNSESTETNNNNRRIETNPNNDEKKIKESNNEINQNMSSSNIESTETKKTNEKKIKNPNNTDIINQTDNQIILDLSQKQNEFIEKFFAKELIPNEEENRESIFIKFQKKKIKIIKDLIQVEDEITLTTKIAHNKYHNTFWYYIHEDIDIIKSRQIYIDYEQVDDSDFEIKDGNIKIKFKPLYNEETKNIKIIYEYPIENPNYFNIELYFDDVDIVAQVLIYADNDYQIDDVSNNKYTFEKDLNIVYFEGITTEDTYETHGYVYCSKKINYQIYQKIPKFKENEGKIIRKKTTYGKGNLKILGRYKNVKITDYGQEIEEIYKVIAVSLDQDQFSSILSTGLMKDIKFEVDLVTLNGKNIEYVKEGSSIVIKNIELFNNQSAEVHLKYKYFTNSDKHVYRQENIITDNIKHSYCNLNIEIPEEYVLIATDGIYKKDPTKNNKFIYNGISNVDKLYEKIKISIKKGVWNIHKEITLTANANITSCVFKINRLFKGGNLKEKSYEFIKDDAQFEDNIKEDRFIYTYKFLNTNKIKIGWKLQIENSTSNYKYDKGDELIEKVPDEDKQFFKDLANEILKNDNSNEPNYKKLGNWVHKYINYDLSYIGKNMTAKEIYNTKIGVCEHFTKLYNTLLVSIDIDAVKVVGYALDRTEEDNNTMKVKESHIEFSKGVLLKNEKHAWSIAKINEVWTPLDATWNMFEGHVPLSHIFSNYGDELVNTLSPNHLYIENEITKEIITFVG